jgi:predicted ATP-grasp superfamily ATP-dependent carboligase
MRVLITDSDGRPALAATRSLGRHGHEVFTAGSAHPSLASVSRHSSGFDAYANPVADPDRFVEDVCAIAARRRIDVLLPMTEITTLLLTQHQQSLPAHVRLPFASAATVAAAADKAAVMALAEQVGVPIPRTRVVHSIDEGRAVAAELVYPIVIKAARSRIWTGKRWLSTSVSYANSAAELVSILAAAAAQTFPFLLQEKIVGEGVGVFLCFDRDESIAVFSHRRIREKPPSGGVSVLCESTEAEPMAVDYAERLLRRLGWQGVAMVEFKRDSRDGSLRLMEINGRFWGSLQLAIDAGVDFPAILVDLVGGKRPPQRPAYRTGVRTRWLWGDVDSLLAVLFRSRQRLNLSANHPGRWATLYSFLKFWQPGMRYELERADDLRPWWLETRRWFFNTK